MSSVVFVAVEVEKAVKRARDRVTNSVQGRHQTLHGSSR